MGGVLTRTNEMSCWHTKPRPLTKNLKWNISLPRRLTSSYFLTIRWRIILYSLSHQILFSNGIGYMYLHLFHIFTLAQNHTVVKMISARSELRLTLVLLQGRNRGQVSRGGGQSCCCCCCFPGWITSAR